jgi:hypothetical protein
LAVSANCIGSPQRHTWKLRINSSDSFVSAASLPRVAALSPRRRLRKFHATEWEGGVIFALQRDFFLRLKGKFFQIRGTSFIRNNLCMQAVT